MDKIFKLAGSETKQNKTNGIERIFKIHRCMAISSAVSNATSAYAKYRTNRKWFNRWIFVHVLTKPTICERKRKSFETHNIQKKWYVHVCTKTIKWLPIYNIYKSRQCVNIAYCAKSTEHTQPHTYARARIRIYAHSQPADVYSNTGIQCAGLLYALKDIAKFEKRERLTFDFSRKFMPEVEMCICEQSVTIEKSKLERRWGRNEIADCGLRKCANELALFCLRIYSHD